MTDSRRAMSLGPLSLGGYWREVHHPLTNLVFVAPLLIAYEGGLLMLGTRAMRNGADVWLRALLELLGFTQYFLLPTLTCFFLLSWQHLRQDRWQIRGRTLYGMLVESILFGASLLLLACLQRWCWSAAQLAVCPLPGWILQMSSLQISPVASSALGSGVASLGAGIYEELLFRLVLLPAFAALLRGVGLQPRASLISAAVASSLLFAAAHYHIEFAVGSLRFATAQAELFTWSTFWFRTVAGLFFSALFLMRGFGIAVGSHAMYDVLVAWPV